MNTLGAKISELPNAQVGGSSEILFAVSQKNAQGEYVTFQMSLPEMQDFLRGVNTREMLELSRELMIVISRNSIGATLFFIDPTNGNFLSEIGNKWTLSYQAVLGTYLKSYLKGSVLYNITDIEMAVQVLKDAVLLNYNTTHPNAVLVSQVVKDYLVNSFNQIPIFEAKGYKESVVIPYETSNNFFATYVAGSSLTGVSQDVVCWLMYVLYLNYCLRVESSDYTDLLLPALPADRIAGQASIEEIFDYMIANLT